MVGRDRYLVVAEDARLARQVSKMISHYGDALLVETVSVAQRVLEQGGNWSGFIIDLSTARGHGLDVLVSARHRYPNVPALVIGPCSGAREINAAYDFGATYLVKPVNIERIQKFVRPRSAFPAKLEATARAWQTRHHLTDAELDVLLRAANGEIREIIAEARGASVHTVRKQISTMLQKLGADTLDQAAARLLREAATS